MINFLADFQDFLAARPTCGATRVIAIDGRAGAGKTTFAQELFMALSPQQSATLIHMDEIYAGWDDALGKSLTTVLDNLLIATAQKAPFLLPLYNWQIQEFDSAREILPTELLILEGVGSAQKIVRESASATIWLEIDPALALSRVLRRDGERFSQEMLKWQRDENEHFYRDKTENFMDFILAAR